MCRGEEKDVNLHRDTRGWAMRHGHSKALLRRRKAAAPCAFRGRNSFSRTVNLNAHHYGWKDVFFRARMRREAAQEIEDVVGFIELESCDVAQGGLEGIEFESMDLPTCHGPAQGNGNKFDVAEGCMPLPCMQEGKQCIDIVTNRTKFSTQQSLHDLPKKPGIVLLRTRSAPCTASEVNHGQTRVDKAYVPLEAWRSLLDPEQRNLLNLGCHRTSTPRFSIGGDRKKGWRWEEASARAAQTMQTCTPIPDAQCAVPTRKQLRQQERQRLEKEREILRKQQAKAWQDIISSRRLRRSRNKMGVRHMHERVQECLDTHQSLVKNGADVKELEQSTRTVFDSFQAQFLWEHRYKILSSLANTFNCFDIKLQPADISTDVQLRFLKAFVQLGGVSASLQPVFHGTKPHNIPSIFARGLLIPGMGNDIRVANGSAHGIGIYTANLSHASLSFGFGGTEGMLVCGVLDDAVELAAPRASGCLSVTAESEAVRHVGGAIVVFDARRVVPLFHVAMPKGSKGIRLDRPDMRRQKENKKKRRTAAIAARHLQRLLARHRHCNAVRRGRRRRRVRCGLNRSGVGATGLASS